MKICIECKKEKELEQFYQAKGCKDGLRKICKECIVKRQTLKRNILKGTFNKSERFCTRCSNIKNNSMFIDDKIRVCNACQERGKKYYEKKAETLEQKFKNWERGAARRKIEFNLTYDDIVILPFVCYYTNKDLTLKRHQPNTVSLDRIDSSKGYIKGNVVLCCSIINFMKQEFDVKDFVDYCKLVSQNETKIIHHDS
jgi:hypothetical protein